MIPEGPASGTVIGGKFKVLRTLGVGGMGSVFEIEHVFTHHRRALKLLHNEVSRHPSVVERFLREASAAGRIGNPHIVETFDAGTLESGEPYLVMEYLVGRELGAVIREHGRLEVDHLAHLMRQACSGVQAAHQAGVVHRDLKPENLFVTERDGRPFVKILDFGISKFDTAMTGDRAMTREGSMLGTPYYMPPEQVRGQKDLDARADVYALGVILYEAASGRRPFEADTLPHLALLIHEGKPAPLSELRPDLPGAFCAVVEKAMATDRERRFASAEELSQALAPFEHPAARDAYAATLAIETSSLGPPTDRPSTGVAAGVSVPAPAPTAGDAPSIEAAALGRTVAQPAKRPGGLAAAIVLLLAGIVLATFFVVRARGQAVPGLSGEAASPAPPSTGVGSIQVAPQTASAGVPASTLSADAAAATAPSAAAKAPGQPAPTPSAATKAKKSGLADENPY